MRHEGTDGDQSCANCRNDRFEIGNGGVPTTKQRHFFAMKIDIAEGDRRLDDTNQHIASGMSNEVEAMFHRLRVSGRVEDN